LPEGVFDTAALARMVQTTPGEQLAEGMRLNREPILAEVFRRWPERLTDRGRRENGVILWRIAEGGGADGYDRWYVILGAGECRTARDLERRPRVTFTVGPVDFLRIATGTADPLRMVLTRRLRMRGDLLWARHLPAFFRVPR
jgi:hypothetical protein